MRYKVVCTVLVSVLLLFAMLCTGTQRVEAEGTTVVYVDPKITYAGLGEPFSINVSIGNVTNLYAFEFRLGYNTTILDIESVDTPPFLNEPTMVTIKEVNETQGWFWYGITSLGPAPPKNGSGTLATITFKVMGVGSCEIDLGTPNPHGFPPTYSKLWNIQALPIPHYVEDGYVVQRASSVGGIWVPVDKLGLSAPYIGLVSTIAVATVATAIYVKHVKRGKKKQ